MKTIWFIHQSKATQPRPPLRKRSPFVGLTLAVSAIAGLQAQQRGALPPPEVTVIEERGYRLVRSNGLPDHVPGRFPRSGNPNTISAQRYEFRMTLNPRPAPRPTPAHGAWFAVAVNGVPFEPGTAEFWNRDPRSGWTYEAMSGRINLGLDEHLAHVQPSGAYHYHGLPTGLMENLGGDSGQRMLLLGWAADGFPVYTSYAPSEAGDGASRLAKMRSSYQIKSGTRPSGPGGSYDGTFAQDYEFVRGSGDLDECNGRFGATPEYPQGIYYYCITEEFPHISRLWKGSPDASFQKRGGGPPSGRPGGGGGEPRRGRRGGPGFGPPPGAPPPGFGPPPGPPPGFGPPR